LYFLSLSAIESYRKYKIGERKWAQGSWNPTWRPSGRPVPTTTDSRITLDGGHGYVRATGEEGTAAVHRKQSASRQVARPLAGGEAQVAERAVLGVADEDGGRVVVTSTQWPGLPPLWLL